MEQQLYKFTKKKIDFSFNPHLLPTFRGILTSIYTYIQKKVNLASLLRNSFN